MTGFVKLRRGLAEHVSSRRMTLVEHGAYTLLLQLADHSTGRWHGTQRSFAAAAGVSSGLAWKILTSLDRKGYLRWNRDKRTVQICKFLVEKPVEDLVETRVENRYRPRTPGHHRNQAGYARDHYIRNTRTLLEKREIVAAPRTLSDPPLNAFSESQSHKPDAPAWAEPLAETAVPVPPNAASGPDSNLGPNPTVLAEVLRELRRLAAAKAIFAGTRQPESCRDRESAIRRARLLRARGDRSPP